MISLARCPGGVGHSDNFPPEKEGIDSLARTARSTGIILGPKDRRRAQEVLRRDAPVNGYEIQLLDGDGRAN